MLMPNDYMKAEGYGNISHAIGFESARKLVDHTVTTLSIKDLGSLEMLLKLECQKLAKLSTHFCNLNPTHPGMHSDDSSTEKCADEAAVWIARASNSKSVPEIVLKNTIIQNLKFGFNFSSITDIERVHKKVAINANTKPRGIVPTDSPVPSSFSGYALLSHQLKCSRISHGSMLYPKYLLGWILGWHPFSDGNGRTARTVYAITSIKNGCWRPLSKLEEDRLSGLGRK